MSNAFQRRHTPDEADNAAASTPAALEDQTFAGPAPDEGAVDVVDPQAGMQPLVSPAESLLRFITCGSVDDGKSTLIGRLLYETNAVFDDQMEALKRDSRKFGTTGEDLDFALLVDGLSAEREQGITIDVAYRYFSTANRAFIIADTPGHEQYTRNMATGASQAEVAVILADARKGILPQTRRHSFITSLVGIKSVVVAINKMDLVDFSEERFKAIRRDYEAILPALGFTDVSFVPVSAKNGDNIASRSPNTPWYGGGTLLEQLETATPETFDASGQPFRMPVQWVNRPDLDFRGFAGTIVGGTVRPGDALAVLPGRRSVRVKEVWGPDGRLDRAETGEAVTLTLDAEVDVSRGDVLVAADDTIEARQSVDAEILWMVDRPLVAGGRFVAKLGAAMTPASVRSLEESVDIHSYELKPVNALLMNEIARITLAFDRPTVATTYAENRELGSFILIDTMTNETVALGIVRGLRDVRQAATAEDAPAAAGTGPFGLGMLTAMWHGGDGRPNLAVIRFRAVASMLVAFLAVVLGLHPLPAILVGLFDFLLRPFLMTAFGVARAGQAEEKPDPTTVGDGAGI